MLTPTQIAAVKYIVARARQDSPYSKRLFWFMLDQSEGLTKGVRVTLEEGAQGFTGDEIRGIAHPFDGMQSCHGGTHLNELLAATGSDFRFLLHYGNCSAGGKFDTRGAVPRATGPYGDEPLRYTFWLAPAIYSAATEVSEQIPCSRDRLDSINLEKPGLYESIESRV